MEKRYIITETELIKLLETYYYAKCLDAEGVDNWSWYMTNKENFLNSYGNFNSFKELAENTLKYFTELEKI